MGYSPAALATGLSPSIAIRDQQNLSKHKNKKDNTAISIYLTLLYFIKSENTRFSIEKSRTVGRYWNP